MCHTAALLGARFRSTESALLGIEDGGPGGDFEVPPGVNMGRRRSRAVLYQLSGHYKPEKIKTKLKLNNVSRKTVQQIRSLQLLLELPASIIHIIFVSLS